MASSWETLSLFNLLRKIENEVANSQKANTPSQKQRLLGAEESPHRPFLRPTKTCRSKLNALLYLKFECSVIPLGRKDEYSTLVPKRFTKIGSQLLIKCGLGEERPVSAT
eukprot:gene22866-9267_t